MNRQRRKWCWTIILLAFLLMPTCYVIWKIQGIENGLSSFNTGSMEFAQYTSKDVIGDLGGVKVRIPRYYAEYAEYDREPVFGKKRKGAARERTFESRLRSFGLHVRFPDMKGLENSELKSEYQRSRLRKDNSWLDISINAGEIYPSLGARATDGLAKQLWEKSQFWFANYERDPAMDVAGLEAYVVSGTDPQTGQLARKSDYTKDVYIQGESNGHVSTYISCGRTSVKGGVASCKMHFGLEPKAKVSVTVSFNPALLSRWRSIKHSVYDFFLSFELNGANYTKLP